ncbi:glutamate ABC transporter substrate-binding protein [Companilactobacillus pabuli]|jgi:putative glutamine transport system substrate-binding protein|uniref:Glutamate ABC transporter substrate-binding protein n=1 Tax=Companilactobacillus pabuli TaxID=2714036 RepID=A0A7L7KZI6_9LACO|nr:glutamate ABC transporter substrate-binding protein [Companilactobacillus pabuli]AKP02942.1 glutamine ABC transporter substrate-binding protein [Companilactobacillus farciminis]AKS51242.1 glutamine ABC transporter substrate-binding protein [Companilactobacillus farciminis]MDG5112015.1 glutamate ABC transporter substrate-binding protein [Companilactobacillus pabuli]QMT85130.1 glutamate ABC transporter substrate-binding protein [Companilactobacillus pabuli]GAQ00821.1 glutamine ABC transporter
MKRLKYLMLMMTSLLLLLTLSACGSKPLSSQNILENDKQSKTITWGVKADTKLLGLIDVKDGKEKGFEIDLATALTKKMLGKDAKAKFVTVTSQSRIPLLKNGNIDAIIATMTITPERQKTIDFSNSYFDAGQSLLVKDDSSVKKVEDLNNKTIIGVVGSNSVENVKKFAPKAQVLQLPDYAQALTALKSGQGDALTTDNVILAGMAVNNPGYKLQGKAFTTEPYGIGINKGQDDFRKAVNKALKEVQQDGTYNKLIVKWFGNVPGFNYKEVLRK